MQGQQRAVIVGGGIMGADIAAIFAAGGHAVDVVQRPGKTRNSLDERIAKAIAQVGSSVSDVVPRNAPSDVPWKDAGIVEGPLRSGLETRPGNPEGGRRKQLA